MIQRPHWHIDEYGYVRAPNGSFASYYETKNGKVLIDYRALPQVKFMDEWFDDHQLPKSIILKPKWELLHG